MRISCVREVAHEPKHSARCRISPPSLLVAYARIGVPFVSAAPHPMIEINPYITHIEDLRQRADSLRGYL